jgi:hypothetical protein
MSAQDTCLRLDATSFLRELAFDHIATVKIRVSHPNYAGGVITSLLLAQAC